MPFPHWQFFESLDDELILLSRTIDFAKENFPTHSVHLTRMYLAICSEVDVVSKLLCSRIAPKEKARTIDDYRELIKDFYPKIPEVKVTIPFHDLVFEPWIEWKSGVNPLWWNNHNKVKHERNKYYQNGNLGNVLLSAAGLLIILTYYHQPEICAYNPPSILRLRRIKSMRVPQKYFTYDQVQYDLPDFYKKAPESVTKQV